MKVKGNKELNTVFKIMGIFSVVTLTVGLGIGYYVRDLQVDLSNTQPATEEKAISTTVANDEYLNKVFHPRLTIVNTSAPAQLFYTIQNSGTSSVYIEKADINVYDSNENIIYTTTLNVYKTYLPGQRDKLDFQLPQDATSIAKVEIDLK